MTDILPPAGWPNVRQLETNEFATGGANGNMNEQAKSLAARSELLKKYAALPYESKTGGYALNERVQLATGDIVRSTIPSNVNNPNVDMSGWRRPSASEIYDDSGITQQEVNSTLKNAVANVMFFGAKPIPGFDNRDAFETAGALLESIGGGALYVPDGVFEFRSVFGTNNCCIKPRSNVSYIGNGLSSVLKFADGLNSDKTYGCTFIFPPESSIHTDTSNISVRDIAFDHNGPNNIMGPAPSLYPFTTGGQAVGIQYGDNITVENIFCLNNAGRQSVMLGTNSLVPTVGKATVRHNKFINCGKSVSGNSSQTDHSSVYALCEESDVYDNFFYNVTKDTVSTAIELHGPRPRAWNNGIHNYGQMFNLAATATDMIDGCFNDNYGRGCAHVGTLWAFSGLSLGCEIDNNTFNIDIALQAQINGITNIQLGVLGVSAAITNNTIKYFGGYTTDDYASFLDITRVSKLIFTGNKFPNGYTGRAVNVSSTLANAEIYLQRNTMKGLAATPRAGYEECFWINTGTTTNIKELIISGNDAVDCDKYLYTIPNVVATIDSLKESGNTISKNMTDVGNVGSSVVLGARAAIIDRVSNRMSARASQGSRVFDTSTGKRYIKATNNETSGGWVDDHYITSVGSGTWVASTLAAGASRSTNITVSNPITATNVINYSFDAPLQGTFISAEYVDATTVKLTQYNPTSGALTFANAVVNVRVS